MNVPERSGGYAVYWKAWAVLLVLTLLMAFSSGGPAVVSAIIGVKAAIIGAWFMHLRHERAALSIVLVVATLATAIILFALIAVDAVKA
jgi:hypothetical protein